ncbi:MAG: LptF/LptG family permease [Alphaproteobacteria bacterium]|nr:LptF/LptG family permease [Alphaproteobacteria bacterium]
MNYLTRYIFGQLFFTVLVTTLMLTCIMWLAQSLRYIDFIANKGAPVLLFCQMILYLLPNLVVIVAPIAVLIGILFVYNKLIADHELIVMQASGVSHWQLAKPALLISCIVTIFLYAFTLYFLPLSFRKYRDITMILREKSLTSLVQVGQFNSLGKYTIYARSQDSQGNFLGVLIYDGTQGEKSRILMAEKGIMLNEEEGGRLLLINGNRQEKDQSTSKPSILYFDQYVVEAKDKTAPEEKEGRFLRTYERYLGDLLNPPQDLSPSMRLEFISHAHQRLLSPLYAFVFGLLSICAMVLGHYNRKGRTLNILLACIFSAFVEVFCVVFLHTLKYSNIMIQLSYGLVIGTIVICLFLLTPWANGILHQRKPWRNP